MPNQPEQSHARYEEIFAEVEAPFAFVDLDAMWANADSMLERAGTKPVRVAELTATLERLLEPGEGGLDAVGRTAQRRLAPPCGRRLGVAARPALEQAAEREPRRLARADLRDETLRGRPLGRMLLEHIRPRREIPEPLCHQTSTRTGRIIGRRPVRS